MSDPASPVEKGHDPYAVLRNRNYLLYLLGRFIASFGGQMLIVAVGWEMYERTHSALHLGYIGLTQMIPMVLLTMPAGHVADNFNRRKIILVTELVMVACCIGLVLVSWLHANVYWMYGCLLVLGCARTFLWPASSAFMPQLVPRELFARAVTWSSGTFQLSAVAGPAAGGAVIALTNGAMSVYALNALAALTCFVLIYMVRYQPVQMAREKITVRNLLTGFKFVFQTKIVFGTITLDMFAVLLGGAVALLPIYAKDILHVGPQGLGVLQAALPIGSLVMAMILAHRPPMERAGRALLWSVIVFGIATVIFGISRSFWLSFLMLFICGIADNVSVVVRHTLVQLLTPDEMRGRVSAVNSLFIGTSNELGGFRSGFVAHYFGPIASVVSGGVGTVLVVVAVALIWPEIRKYGRLGT